MNKILIVLTVLFIGCKNAPGNQKNPLVSKATATESRSTDSTAAVKIVQDFFKAFDERDYAKMDTTFYPEAKIIHNNGVITSVPELLQIVKETTNWWPRTRTLSGYELLLDHDIAVLGLKNEVVFSLPGNKKVSEPYQETWVFKKTNGSWKTIRCHYSKVITDKHSEEVH